MDYTTLDVARQREDDAYDALMHALGSFVTCPTFTIDVTNKVLGISKPEHERLTRLYAEWTAARLDVDREKRILEREAQAEQYEDDTTETLGVEDPTAGC